MRKLFSRLVRAAQVKPAGSRRARLQVRALEERCCPSGGAVEWSDPIPIYNQSGDWGNTGANCYSAVVQPSGNIVYAGRAVLSNRFAVTLAESDSHGNEVTSFGSNGSVINSQWAPPYQTSGDVVVLYPTGSGGDQKILVVGPSSTSAFELARYNAAGSLDTSFGKKGIVNTPFTQGTSPWSDSVVLVANGSLPPKILVAGADSGGAGIELARYNGDGSLDTSFGSGGKAYTPIPGGFALSALALDPVSGDFIAAGELSYTSYQGLLVALHPSGTLDTTFGTNGIVNTAIQGAGNVVYGNYSQPSLAVYPTTDPTGNAGKIVIGGNNGVARYNTAGGLDMTWGTVNTVATDSLAIQSDGKILASGYDWNVARLNLDGSLDSSFGSGGVTTAPGMQRPTFPASREVLVQPNGDILEIGTTIVTTSKGQANAFAAACFLPSEPEIGSFTASQSTAGAPVILTASNITDGNPNSTISQVTFFYYDSSGNQIIVGTATAPDNSGNWTVSASLPPGSCTLYAQATDSYGVLGDPLAYTLTIQ